MQEFELWCESVGLNLSLTHLPTLQMAVVQWSLLNIIGLSCKAYSQLRSCLPVALNEHVTVGDIPLFHNTMFRNEHGQTYFSKKPVAEGLTTIGPLNREPWKLGLFPPSFHSAYSERAQSLLQAQANMSEYWWASFILSASPKSFFPLIVSAQSSTARLPPEVW